jgi:hypothetical protein
MLIDVPASRNPSQVRIAATIGFRDSNSFTDDTDRRFRNPALAIILCIIGTNGTPFVRFRGSMATNLDIHFSGTQKSTYV